MNESIVYNIPATMVEAYLQILGAGSKASPENPHYQCLMLRKLGDFPEGWYFGTNIRILQELLRHADFKTTDFANR